MFQGPSIIVQKSLCMHFVTLLNIFFKFNLDLSTYHVLHWKSRIEYKGASQLWDILIGLETIPWRWVVLISPSSSHRLSGLLGAEGKLVGFPIRQKTLEGLDACRRAQAHQPPAEKGFNWISLIEHYCGASFHVLIGHLELGLGALSLPIFCPL